MWIYKMPVEDKRPITLYLLSQWTVAIYLNRRHIRQRRCNFRSLQQEQAGIAAGGGVGKLFRPNGQNPNDLT